MTHDTPQDIIDELDQLLDRERNALIAGDLDQIGRLMEAKETLIDRMSALGAMERSHLVNVQAKVTRNQALLASAMDGIRAVADRMAALRRVRDGLETYDETGRKTQFSTAPNPNVEKRA